MTQLQRYSFIVIIKNRQNRRFPVSLPVCWSRWSKTAAISDDVKSFYDLHRRREAHPTLDQLTDVLISEIRTYSKVFIVVDALDECREDDATRAMLLEVLRSLPRQVNLMVTSRNLPSIGRDFEGAKRLHIRAKDDDMKAYIEGRIALGPRHLKNSKEAIVNKILENAKGM